MYNRVVIWVGPNGSVCLARKMVWTNIFCLGPFRPAKIGSKTGRADSFSPFAFFLNNFFSNFFLFFYHYFIIILADKSVFGPF